jgi:hypothetical protein
VSDNVWLSDVSLKNILAIADALDVPPAAFFEGIDERN